MDGNSLLGENEKKQPSLTPLWEAVEQWGERWGWDWEGCDTDGTVLHWMEIGDEEGKARMRAMMCKEIAHLAMVYLGYEGKREEEAKEEEDHEDGAVVVVQRGSSCIRGCRGERGLKGRKSGGGLKGFTNQTCGGEAVCCCATGCIALVTPR